MRDDKRNMWTLFPPVWYGVIAIVATLAVVTGIVAVCKYWT